MTKEEASAQLRAAAWQLVALIGSTEAQKVLGRVREELNAEQFRGPGSR